MLSSTKEKSKYKWENNNDKKMSEISIYEISKL